MSVFKNCIFNSIPAGNNKYINCRFGNTKKHKKPKKHSLTTGYGENDPAFQIWLACHAGTKPSPLSQFHHDCYKYDSKGW